MFCQTKCFDMPCHALSCLTAWRGFRSCRPHALTRGCDAQSIRASAASTALQLGQSNKKLRFGATRANDELGAGLENYRKLDWRGHVSQKGEEHRPARWESRTTSCSRGRIPDQGGQKIETYPAARANLWRSRQLGTGAPGRLCSVHARSPGHEPIPISNVNPAPCEPAL